MSDAPKMTEYPLERTVTWIDDETGQEVGSCHYTRTDSIPSPDALIRAALEAAVKVAVGYDCRGYDDDTDRAARRITDAIRALANNPEALARIAKAAEGRG
jgi:hypothetical protein